MAGSIVLEPVSPSTLQEKQDLRRNPSQSTVELEQLGGLIRNLQSKNHPTKPSTKHNLNGSPLFPSEDIQITREGDARQ